MIGGGGGGGSVGVCGGGVCVWVGRREDLAFSWEVVWFFNLFPVLLDLNSQAAYLVSVY